MQKRIAIIGGGAAGMMVAATLLEDEHLTHRQIHLFEKNSKLGAKVIISGGGRCNVTTGFFKMNELLPKYPRGAEFLQPALEQFGPRAIRRWFEAHGVPLKEEEDKRIFPVSDDGKDIVRVFEELFARGGVQVHLKEGVKEITRQWTTFQIVTDQKTTEVDAVVLTTGGNAYAHTGSTGDGYARARTMGHTITPLGPSLNSFLTAEEWLHGCSGISFPDASLCAWGVHLISWTPIPQSRWPILLTHFGLSGPAVFAFSSHIPYEKVSKAEPYTVYLQPVATLDKERRNNLFTKRAVETPTKEIGSMLRAYMPKKFVDTLLGYHLFDPHMKVGNMTKKNRLFLSTLLWWYIILQLIQRRPGDEFVTAGGVSRDEIDPETGQSRLVPWLYFAGEILDVDGYTGGYNLTSSRAMGRLVGKHLWR
jgi:predicted Rossmann fold flavoprotein